MSGSWLETIFDKIEFLWPLVRIQKWEKGLRTTFYPRYPKIYFWPYPSIIWVPARVKQTILSEGLHRLIPWIEEIHEYGVVQDSIPLAVQSLTTLDGRSITIQFKILYIIFNVEKATNKVQQFTSSMTDLSEMYVNEQVREYTLNDLVSSQKALELSLMDALNKYSKKWGVKVIKAGITQLTETTNYRHFGNMIELYTGITK